MKLKALVVLGFLFAAVFYSCERKVDDPIANPFEGNTEDTTSNNPFAVNSIQGLHKNIFAVKCANPTCHDGTFEPDFRTVQSTYNSLVYQPVIKNNAQNSFKYRVIPGNIKDSWLVERLITADQNLGKMPLYAPELTQQELLWVYGWITDGAKDLNGNVSVFPNKPPTVNYFVAYNSNNDRIDTNRLSGWSSPFFVSMPSTFSVVISVEDDSTAAPNLLVNELKVSLIRDDFTNAQTIQATYLSGKFWVASLNTANFPSNTQLYFRYFVQDTDSPTVSEFPRNDSQYWYKENASFIIQ